MSGVFLIVLHLIFLGQSISQRLECTVGQPALVTIPSVVPGL